MTVNKHNNQQNKSQSDCDELRDLLPAYVIGATTAEETGRVQQLLEVCPQVAEELPIYAAMVDGLLEDIEPLEPPAHLRANLLNTIAESAKQVPTPPNVMILPKPDGKSAAANNRAWWVAVAASILLIATNIFWVVQSATTSNQLALVQEELVTTQNQLVNLQQQQDDFARLVAADMEVIPLYDAENEVILASVLWNETANQATLYTDELPTLDAEHTYQLWVMNSDGATSIGLFQPDTTGTGLYVFQPESTLIRSGALGISVEPASGSETPTTAPIAVGELRL